MEAAAQVTGAPGVSEAGRVMSDMKSNAMKPPPLTDPSLDPEAQKRIADAAAQERKARGRAATMLTGGQGLVGPISSARRTLLGA